MRLIDADKLKAEFTGNFDNKLWHYTAIRGMIDTEPTVDAVEVGGGKMRLIDADVIIKKLNKEISSFLTASQCLTSEYCKGYNEGVKSAKETLINLITEMPEANAVEVVRCGDCKFASELPEVFDDTDCIKCNLYESVRGSKNYCCYGKEK